MNAGLVLAGGLALWWWLTQPAAPASSTGPGLPPGAPGPPVPAGTIILPDGIMIVPGAPIPPPGVGVPVPGVIPSPVIIPVISPSRGSVVLPVTGAPPAATIIPDPRPIIGVTRDVMRLTTFQPSDTIPADEFLPSSLPGDVVIGTIQPAGEILSIQEEIEGLLGLPPGPETALLDAIQSLSPEETAQFVQLVADDSGLSFGAVQAGMSQLGLIGGPLGAAMGVVALTQGNAGGIAGIVGGIGITLTSLASTGAGASLGMSAATLAATASVGVGLSLVGGIVALGPLFNSLFNRGGIFSTSIWRSPVPGLSFAAGRQGHTALVSALTAATTLRDLTAIAAAQWAPHGEVQIGSTMDRFGWGGDWDDPASPQYLRMLTILRIPALVALGLPDITDFIRGLWVQGPGQTGDVPRNPESSFLLQRKFAEALPALPAYAGIKAAVREGGDLWAAAEEARRVRAKYEADRKALSDATAIAIAASYGEPSSP